jgi:hypothetical protein
MHVHSPSEQSRLQHAHDHQSALTSQVLDVLGDRCAALCDSGNLSVGAGVDPAIAYVRRVMTVLAKSLTRRWWKHLLDQEAHALV